METPVRQGISEGAKLCDSDTAGGRKEGLSQSYLSTIQTGSFKGTDAWGYFLQFQDISTVCRITD
jgi:hypothetical protein